MLGFSRQKESAGQGLQQLDFEPLVISNRPVGHPPLAPGPPKQIVKAHNKGKDPSRKKSVSSRQRKANPEQREGWVDRGRIEVFDQQIRKNALAEQERRLRAEARKMQTEAVREITRNEKKIRGKTAQLEQQQEKEIAELRRLIEKEQAEKAKEGQAFQAKLKELEEERLNLVRLERKIQEHGVRHQKQYVREMAVLQPQNCPTNDRANCRQEVRSPGQKGPMFEVSETEANAQRQALRQEQLALLVQQRQRSMQNQLQVSYNPTIVPLLSRASYKIISTHVSTLVQLLVDDLLEEQVYLLEEIELEQKAEEQKQRQKNVLQDYCAALDQFAEEAEAIEDRVGNYHALHFEDLYLPKKYPPSQPKEAPQTDFGRTCLLSGLEPEAAQAVGERRDRLLRFLSNFDEYKRGHLAMFAALTEQLIDEAIAKMAHELDRGSNDFVDLIFRRQFQ